MKLRLATLGVVCLLIAGIAGAQEEPGTVGRIYTFKVKAGMEQQFEDAVREHFEWRQQQGDPWTWMAFTVETGEDSGQYGFVSGGHHWSDFDSYDAELRDAVLANFRQTVWPYVDSYENVITESLPDFSKPPGEDYDFRMVQVFHYYVKYDQAQNWTNAIAKINKALTKHEWPSYYSWSTLLNGGTGPVYTLAVYHDSWASMAQPDTAFPAVMEEAYGRFEADSIMQAISDSVVKIDSWMARLRPDLSYIPAAGY
jgi:hypothetical protein